MAKSAARRGLSPSGQRSDVAHERTDLQAAAGCVLDERDRVEATTVAVDALGEPALDGRHLATAKILLQRPGLRLHRLPQRRRDQAAKRVAGEVPEATRAPMDVLEDPGGVGGHLESEQAAHPVLPCRGEIR